MGTKKKYRVYKKGGESFNPHMMYNPRTNEGYLANTYDEHLRMNDMGYGHESMMRDGGTPCFECGGTTKYEFGGSSVAPQNVNTGDIGRTRIDLMKNHLAENMVKNILQQRDELVAQMTEQMYQYGGVNYDPRLKENPNRAFGTMAAQNYYGARNQAMESGKDFWNSIQDFAQNYQTPRQYQPPMQKVQSKTADLSGAYAPTQPQLAVPQGGYKGVADYMQKGGSYSDFTKGVYDLVEQYPEQLMDIGESLGTYQSLPNGEQFLENYFNQVGPRGAYNRLKHDANLRDENYLDHPTTLKNAYYNVKSKFQDGGSSSLPMAQKGLNFNVQPTVRQVNPALRAKYRKENPNIPFWGEMEGSNDPATGYWDRVAQDWSKPLGVGGWEESEMYEDPRMTKAVKKLIPGMGAEGVIDYFSNLWTMPQKAVNKWLTGYYESPMTTYERYNEPLSGGAKFAADVATDPMMYPELPVAVAKGVYKAGAKGVAKAAPYVKKGAEKVVEQTAKAYEATKKLIGKYFPTDFLQQHGALILSRAMQAGVHAETDPERQKAMLDNLVKQELSKVAPQQSTQVQVPVIRPVAAQQNPFGNISPEDLQKMFPSTNRRYGGDLPKAQSGNLPPVSLMNNDLYNQGLLLANTQRYINQLTNPFYTPVSEPSVSKYNRFNVITGEPYNVDKKETVTGSSAKAGAAAADQARDKGKSTPSTAAEVAEQQTNKDTDSKTTPRTGNTDEASEGPTTTDTKTDTTTTGNVRTVGDGYGYYGQPMGRFKLKGSIKEYDPLTGKMIKKTRIQPLKYDTAYGPQNVFGRRGPRVVKIPINQTYNINPFRMDLTPGSESFNALYNTSGSSSNVLVDDYNAAAEQAYYDNMMNDYYNDYMKEQSWQSGDYKQPGSFRSRSEEMPPVTADQIDWRYKGMQDDGVGPSRKDVREARRRDRITDREKRQMNKLFDKANRDFPSEPATYQKGGQKAFNLNNYQPGQFTEGFGPQEGGFGPMEKGFNLWETGESPYMSTVKETDLEGKWKQKGLGQGWSMLGPGLAFLGDALNARQIENPDWAYTASATKPMLMANDADRGHWTSNAGNFFKYGGQMYQDGGEYELTDQEIQAIISAGGEVEFL